MKARKVIACLLSIQGNRMKKYKKYVIIDQRELVNNEKIF